MPKNVNLRLKRFVDKLTKSVSKHLNQILLFPVWYFIFSWGFWYKFVTRTFLKVYDRTGLEVLLRNLIAPFRRDRTFAGYLVGIVIRVVVSAVSIIFLSVITAVLLIAMLAFYLAPFIIGFYNPTSWLIEKLVLPSSPILDKLLSFKPSIAYLLPYFGFWFVFYVIMVFRSIYWENVKKGKLNTRLRHEVWKRLEFDPKEADKVFFTSKKDFIMYLKRRKLNEQDLLSAKNWVLRKEYDKQSWKYWKDDFFYRQIGVNVGWVAGFLPELKRFSIDLTKEAAENDIPHTYGREREVERLLTVLSRSTRNNVLIVGEAGVGKTSLVYAIAWLLLGRRDDIDIPNIDQLIEPIEGRRVIELNTGGLVGGESSRYNSAEARLNKALRELTAGNTLLFVNQVENLVQAGLIGYLTPIIRSTRFPIIATTNTKVYREQLQNIPEFTSEFEVIKLDPPGIVEAVRILEGVATDMEKKNRVFFTYPALHAVAELSERYIHDSVLPEKGIKVMIKAIELSTDRVISVSDVEDAIAKLSGVPVGELAKEEADKLLHLEQLLKKRVIGQDEAIRTISKALRRARTGVSSRERPIASLLFLGPTGVGKTLTAKSLAQVYFTPQTAIESVSEIELNRMIKKNFIRFDMSEFSETGSVTNFIERMTEEVKNKPFSLILLDELEKAEPEIHNLFLQIFEDGRLTNRDGQTMDFRNSIIIATSNAVRRIPPNVTDTKTYVREKLEEFFRPELINRFDGIVTFHEIGHTQIEKIVVIELNRLAKRLKEEHEITITWTKDLVKELAQLGYDPEFGARPLRRIIQDRIEDTLAQKLLRKELQFGDSYQLTVQDLQ